VGTGVAEVSQVSGMDNVETPVALNDTLANGLGPSSTGDELIVRENLGSSRFWFLGDRLNTI
jgi:hypothetical protein